MSHSSLCGTMEIVVNVLACYCSLLHLWKTDHRRTELRCTIINHAKVNHTLTSGVWDHIRTKAISTFSCWHNAPRCFEFTPAFSHRVWLCTWNHRKICQVRGTLMFVRQTCCFRFPLLLLRFALAGSWMSSHEASVFEKFHYCPSRFFKKCTVSRAFA